MRRRTMQTIDCHAAGEPLRVVTAGLPPLEGDTILARRAYMAAHLDHVRRFLMWEPRGHADMYGCIVTPPVSPSAFCGVLFMHNEGYSTMCGHGIIGLVTVLIETGQLPAAEPEVSLALDTPAGLVRARASVEGGRVREVTMRNVASFVLDRRVVPVEGLGDVAATVAYGGAFYALVDAPGAGLGERPGPLGRLVEAAAAIKAAVLGAGTIAHPIESGIDGLYGVVMGWPPQRPGADQTSLTVFADREVDRSPCGTCTSAVMAARWADGRLPLGAPFVNESLIGTRFSGRLAEETRVGPHRAVTPEVSGSASITGYHTFVLAPDDPLPDGFLLR
ncbi:MAG TPA: proline racemase family protein [bacterium]|nr:proline racemase family protein [bacterium]